MCKRILILFVLAVPLLGLSQTTWTSISAGDWNDPGIWSTDGGNSGCSCTPPTKIENNDEVVMRHGTSLDPITLNGTELLIEATGQVTMDNAYLLIEQNITVKEDGIMDCLGSYIRSVNGNIQNEGTFQADETCIYLVNGNFENKSGAELTQSGNVYLENGNIQNSGTWGVDVDWCALNGNSDLPPGDEDCTTTEDDCVSIEASLLPVELLSFYGIPDEYGVMLHWATASEINNDGFLLEYSLDGDHYQYLAWASGNGTAHKVSEYKYEHKDANKLDSESIYYRLTQIDYDGLEEVFPVKRILLKKRDSEFSIFPNPVQEKLTVSFNGLEQGIYNILLKTMNGRIIQNLKWGGNNNALINFLDVNNGIYLIEIYNSENQRVMTKSLIKY